MLFGKKFKIEKEEKNIKQKKFCRVGTDKKIMECSTFNKDILSLQGRPDPYNDPIMFQIQLRGAGKTKSLYDLGMKKDIIYIDFTTKNNGTQVNSIPFCTALSEIKNLNKLKLKLETFENENELRDRVQEILSILIYSNIIYHGFFREMYKDKSPEYFLRHFLNGGQNIIDELFKSMLEYDMEDIEKVIKKNYQNNIMFAFDEVGCLEDCFKGYFLKKNIEKNSFNSNDNTQFRGLFEIFSETCLMIKKHQFFQSNI
jgi:hypothetical protein